MTDLAEEMRRLAEAQEQANQLKEQEVQALNRVARAQETAVDIAKEKSKEGTRWQKFWHGGNGGAGARSRHMRMNW